MAAYQVVASTIGTSASWLRKFINGSEAKEPGWTTGWNILDHYNRICERVEHEIETERTKTLALRKSIDAITSTIARMETATEGAPANVAGATTGRTKAARAHGHEQERGR